MAVQFLPQVQPEYPRNALLEVAGINQGIDSLGNAMRFREQQNYRMAQDAQENRRADARLAAFMDERKKALEKRAYEQAGVVGQAILSLPPEMQGQAWAKTIQSHPNMSSTLTKYGIDINNPAAGAKFLVDMARGPSDPLEDELRRAQIAKIQREASTAGVKPAYTPAETAVDRAFAKSYEEDIASGGMADQQKNLDQLRAVKKRLTEGGENLTGPVVGRLPDVITSFTNPQALDTRERVEEVVQRNLRVILGAQFTNEEGKRLIARAYNPALPEEVNAQRLENLITAMDRALQAKKAAAQYYEQNGTLRGYRGPKLLTASDLDAAIDATPAAPQAAPMAASVPAGEYVYNPQTGRVEPKQ